MHGPSGNHEVTNVYTETPGVEHVNISLGTIYDILI